MDSLLIITILTIFAAAFIGTVIKYSVRDKCLKGFADYFVTIEMKDGKRVWGKLDVYHNGLELTYPSPHLDPDGSHFETSYIVFQDQFPSILMLKRLHDELSPKNQKRRKKELRKTYHPNVFRRLGRRIRNVFNLLRDAVGQAFTVFLGSIKKAGGSQFVSSQDAKIQSTAKDLIAASASAYEPILEKYIGRKVVLEIQHNDKIHEYCGILRDYTDKFITVLNVPVAQEHEFILSSPAQLEVNRDLDFEVSSEPHAAESGEATLVDLHIRLNNHGKRPVHVCHAEGPDYSQVIDQEAEPGKTIEFDLANVPLPKAEKDEAEEDLDVEVKTEPPAHAEQNALPDVRLWIRGQRYMDLVMPRPAGVIRHGAESIGQLNVKFFLKLVTP